MLDIRPRRNPQYAEGKKDGESRYYYELNLEGIIRERPKVPIFWKPNEFSHILIKEIYYCDIAGIRLEKGNLGALEQSVQKAVLELVKYSTLPSYYLILTEREESIPVYPLKRGFQARPGEGPQFSGTDIGQLWDRVSDYLVRLKRIKRKEELEINLLSWRDLKLYPPGFILSYGDGRNGLWMPIFYEEGPQDNVRLHYDTVGLFPKNSGPTNLSDVSGLLKKIGSELTQKGKISSPYDLRLVEVCQEIWHRLERIADPTGLVLSYYDARKEEIRKMEMPIFNLQEELMVQQRGEGILSIIHFGRDIQDLKNRIAADLGRQNIVLDSSYLTIETRGHKLEDERREERWARGASG